MLKMKYLILLLLTFAVNKLEAQLVSGDLLTANRIPQPGQNFEIISAKEGVVYYEIAVDEQGYVLSHRFLQEQSTLSSSPIKIEAVNYLKKLRFTNGSLFPKHQRGVVKISFIKKD